MYLQHKAVICWSLKLLLETNAIENGYMFKLHQTNNISWRLQRRKRSTYYLLHWLIIIERFHSHGQHIRKFFWNKRKRLHKKSVQIPKNLFGTPTWPPFYCFRTPIWPPWRHVKTLYRVFSLTWSASMQIYWNKRNRLHKKRAQLPQDWFGTPIWLPWHHVKTLCRSGGREQRWGRLKFFHLFSKIDTRKAS